MKRLRPRITYANVASTLALFFALSGGVAFAASRIHSGDIAPGAVRSSDLHQRAVTSGKLAVGSVRTNQIADGAVGAAQLAPGLIAPVKAGSASTPSSQPDALSVKASPTGGSLPVPDPGEPVEYPLNDATWRQKPGEVNLIFGEASVTVAHIGIGACGVQFSLKLNGRELMTQQIGSFETVPTTVQKDLGLQSIIDPPSARDNVLSVVVSNNGYCSEDSVIDFARFRVLSLG